jgi:hypothetical protein
VQGRVLARFANQQYRLGVRYFVFGLHWLSPSPVATIGERPSRRSVGNVLACAADIRRKPSVRRG